ncbi:class I SAM-dependent methyltransferase [Mucilaginibacter ginsenosidivorans]|nr:class I SAM-dependent methyltransferase [Mucilaginibacter ginsenosidivorans]
MVSPIEATLDDFVRQYENTGACNDDIFETFTRNTDRYPFLKEHRDYIEQHRLGYGDRAFHYMWYLIIRHVQSRQLKPDMLEIGVFKGQVVSLWSLIAQTTLPELRVTGITPLSGKKIPGKWERFFKARFSAQYRKDLRDGNFYEETDYLRIIEGLFRRFSLEFTKFRLIRGYSTDGGVRGQVAGERFSVIYIDGDHSYDTVVLDIRNFSGLIVPGGLLVMDDASCDLPGTKFWKGHQGVSEACRTIESFGFKNILNVGHNRIYQKDK